MVTSSDLRNTGVPVASIEPGCPVEQAGIRVGDRLRFLNGHRVRDEIDLLFYDDREARTLEFSREETGERFTITLDSGGGFGFELEPFRTKTCKNKCVFCFVSQLPRGMRRSLYVKDEDYRLSFLYGNYITLSNLSEEERARIIEQRLSPLYISVHATDPVVRRELLRSSRPIDVMAEIRRFAEAGIRMHTQIVLCPGLNDGAVLDRSIRELGGLYPSVASLAVVPVGLTKYRTSDLRPLGRSDAEAALDTIETHQARFRAECDDPFVFGSDELYLRARRPFPPVEDYGEFPQIENGVGLVQDFFHRLACMDLRSAAKRDQNVLVITGRSFERFLTETVRRMTPFLPGRTVTVVGVENDFFGPEVTVAGLLTGKDVVTALRNRSADRVIVPSVMLREGDRVFLDDVTVESVAARSGATVRVVEPGPEALWEELKQ